MHNTQMSKGILSRIWAIAMVIVLACTFVLSDYVEIFAADEVVEIKTFTTSFRSGGTKVDGWTDPSGEGGSAYVWNATNNQADHRYTFRITYTHSGTRQYQPGELQIVIPRSILRDRNGDPADYYDIAVPAHDDPELAEATGDIKWVYSDNYMEIYDRNGWTDSDTVYTYDSKSGQYTAVTYDKVKDKTDNDGEPVAIYSPIPDDCIIIYNDRPVDAAGNGYIEVSYLTSENTYEYIDYDADGSLSDAFTATMTATQGEITKTADTKPMYVGMNTQAEINWTEKRYPDLYSAWNNSWGTEAKPEDADKYYYLLWEIRTDISNTSQPYDFYIQDTFDNIDGEVVGYRMQGDSKFSLPVDGHSRVVENIKTDYRNPRNRYDYVLTRHLKETYQDLSSYEIKNEVVATVHPVDGVDPDTSANSNKLWRYQKPTYTKPTGHFMLFKYGNDYRASGYSTDKSYHVRSSEDIRDFSLDDFKKGKTDTISNLRYEVQQIGYQWPWTIGESDDWRDTSKFGQKEVRYIVYDNEFYLNEDMPNIGDTTFEEGFDYNAIKNKKLTKDDYQIDTLMFTYAVTDAEFDDDRQAFVTKSGDQTNDNIEFYAEVNGNWVKFGTYNAGSGTWSGVDADIVKSANGRRVDFKNDSDNIVTGWKAEYANKHYSTNFYAFPYVTLKNSDKVMAAVDGMDKISLLNINHSNVMDYKGDTIVDFDKAGIDYIIGVSKDGHIQKKVTGYKNDKIRRQYVISWRTEVSEDYRTNGGTRTFTTQESGTFYDLLPLGGDVRTSSIKVYGDGGELDENLYDYEIKKNYKDSGRDLLIIKIKESAKKYSVTYDTVHSWESIKDFGTDAVNNIAYETGNEDIGDGYPDNGGKSGVDEFKGLNDDPSDDNTGEKFLYSKSTHIIDIITAAALNLQKKVKSEDQETYTYETVVYRDSEYSYRIRFASDEDILAKNIIIYDSLENYKVQISENGNVTETRESDWQGTLKSIDLTQVRKLGIDPVVYYSDLEKLDIDKSTGAAGNDYDNVDLARLTNQGGDKVWYTEAEFKSKYGNDWQEKVKAFAVDMRKNSKGEEYILPSDTSVSITVIMQSPDVVERSDSGRYDTYNNIWMISSVKSKDDDFFPDSQLDHQDYTKVSYRATGDVKMTKVNVEEPSAGVEGITFRLSGTSVYGDKIDETRISAKDGTFTFKKIPQGDYELQETKANDDWLEDHTVYHIHIDEVGAVTIDELTGDTLTVGKVVRGEDNNTGRYLVANTPRIHGDLKFRKKSLGQDSDLVEVVKKISAITPLADLDVDTIKVDPSKLKVTIDGTDFIVLAKEDGKALLMQCETTDAIEDGFDVNKADWSNSNIRSYLNGDYLEGRDILNQIILESNIKTRNAQTGTTFIDTTDKAFLLSGAGINPNGRLYTTIMWQADDFTIPAAAEGALKFDKIKEAVELGGTSPYTATRNAYRTAFHAYTTSYSQLAMNYSSPPQSALAHPVMWVAVDNNLTTQINLSDTTFKLEGTSDYGTEVLEYATSTSAGRVTFTNLEKGTYKLTETKAKDGYIINQTEWTVKVDDTGNVSIADEDTGDPLVDVRSDKRGEQYLQNEEYHDFSLRKIDAQNNSITLEGAEFNLSGTSDYGTRVDITKESGTNGTLRFEGLEAGTYVLRETKAPTGVDDNGNKGGNRNYTADPVAHIVTIDVYGNVTIEGLNNVIDPTDGKEVPNYFDVENDRALDGQIKVIKKWDDGLKGDDAANRPEPRVTVSSQEPEQDHITLTLNWDDGLLSASKRPTVIPYLIDDEGNVIETGDPSGWIKNGDKWTYTYGVTVDDNTNYETYVKLTKDGSTETTIYTTDSVRTGLSSGHPVAVHNHSASINLVDNSEAYAKFDSSTGVMTFFRDEKYNASAGTGYADKSTDGTTTYYRGMESGEYASDYSRPWNDIAKGANSTVTKLVFEDGIKPSSTKYWFYNMQNLNEIDGLELLDTSNVGSMHMMFMLCKSLKSLDVSSFDFSNVGSLQGAFSNLTSLKTIEMPTAGKGSTNKLHNATAMFQGCTVLQSVDLSAFDFSGVTRTENMFNGCYAISNIYVDSNTWTVKNVTSGSYMFGGCSNLPHYIEGYTGVELAFVGEDPNGTWGYLSDINESGSNGTSSTASTSSVAGKLAALFSATSLKSAPAKAPAATDIASGTLVNGSDSCPWRITADGTLIIGEEGETSVLSKSSWGRDLFNAVGSSASKVKAMKFEGRVIAKANDANAFRSLFTRNDNGYYYANYINLEDVDLTNLEFSSLPTTLSRLFQNNSNLKSVNFGTTIDTSQVKDFSRMFESCSSLTKIEWGDFDTSSATTLSYMFSKCYYLESLDLTSIDVGKVTNTSYLLDGCSRLKTLNISSWDTTKFSSVSGMFKGTTDALAAIAIGPKTIINTTMSQYLVNGWKNNNTGPAIERFATLEGRRLIDDRKLSSITLAYQYPGWYKIAGKTAPNEADMWDMYVTGTDPNAVPDADDTGDPKLKWRKLSDDTWEYTFSVFDDEQEYYVWEDKLDGYYSDTYKADYQIMNDENGNNIKQVTITNSKEKTPPDESKYGDLSLTKTVAPAEGETLTDADKKREFAFTITLSGYTGTEMLSGTTTTATDDGSGNVTTTKEKQDVVFKDGVGTVYLRHGQTFELKHLPEDTTYTITEQQLTEYEQAAKQDDGSDGVKYTEITDLSDLGLRDLVWIEDTENDGYKQVEFHTVQKAARAGTTKLYTKTIGASGTIAEDDPQDVTFTNTKKSEEEQPHNGFKLVKNVKGTLGDVTKEFEFHIALANLTPDTEYTYKVTKRGLQGEAEYTITSDHRGEANIELRLRDDESFEIAGLPAKKADDANSTGATYRITEMASDHTAAYVITDDHVAEGYKKHIEQSKMDNSENDKSLSTKNETVDADEEITVTYNNTRDITTVTGLVQDTWPWNFLLVLFLFWLAYDDARKRAKKQWRRHIRHNATI